MLTKSLCEVSETVIFSQAASNEEDAFEQSGQSELEVPSCDRQGEQLSRNESQTDLKEHISLTIQNESNLVRSASELSLPSEVGEDGESAPSHHSSAQSLHTSHDGTDGGNFVNPKGVKFIPHQHTHEGKLFKIDFLAHLSRRLVGELIVYPWSGVRPSSVVRRPSFTISNMNISATSGPIATKFYLKHHWVGGKAALG